LALIFVGSLNLLCACGNKLTAAQANSNIKDHTPLGVTIATAVAPVNNSTSLAIAFTGSGTDVSALTFSCALDSTTYTTCISPLTLPGLSNGSHQFSVMAIDPSGALSSTQSVAWVTNLTPPSVSLTSTPASIDNLASGLLLFTGTDSAGESLTFDCQLDSAPVSTCSSPFAYAALAQGSHNFSVTAKDVAGNMSTPATVAWTVDLTPPTVTISSGPASSTTLNMATFVFSGSDTGGGSVASYQCQLDAGAFANCTSPASLTLLPIGAHTFNIEALDTAGNTSSPSQYNWTVVAPASKLAFTTPPSAVGTAGVALSQQPIAAVEDSSGTLVASSSATITLSLYGDSGCSTSPIVSTPSSASAVQGTSIAAVSGSANFTSFAVNAAGTVYVKASSPGLTSACSSAVAIAAGSPNLSLSSVVANPSSNVVADGTTTATITFTVEDQFGNPIGNQSVPFTVSSSDNILSAVSPLTTNSSGIATVTLASTLPDTKTIVIGAPSPLAGLSSTVTFQLPGCTNPVWVQANYAGTQTGSQTQPYNSLTSAFTHVSSGGCLLLRAGLYQGALYNITTLSNLSILGIKGEYPVVSGAVPITSWSTYQTLAGGNIIYKGTLPPAFLANATFSSVIVNYSEATPAHFPTYNWMQVPSNVSNTASSTTFTDTNLIGLQDLTNATIQYYSTTGNGGSTVRIASFNPSTGTVTTTQSAGVTSLDRYLITNSMQFLQPKQWSVTYDPTNGYQVFYETNNPSDLNNFSFINQRAVIGLTTNGNTVSNLVIIGSNVAVAISGSNNTISNNIMTLNNNGVAIRGALGALASNNTIIKNIISGNANGGMYPGAGISVQYGNNTLITQNEIGFNGNDAIDAAGGMIGFTLTNNYIHHHHGIFAHPDGLQMWGATGGGVGTIQNITVDSNLEMFNMQEVYTMDDCGGNIAITNNALLESGADTHLPDGQVNAPYLIANNSYILPGLYAFNAFYGSTFSIRDNIFSQFNQGAGLVAYSDYGSYSLAEEDYNLFNTCSTCNAFSFVHYSAPGGSMISWNNYLASNGVAPIYSATGLEQHSKTALGHVVFKNMPLTTSTLSAATVDMITNTQTSLVISTSTGFNVGDTIEFEGNGIARKILAVTPLAGGKARITFDIPLNAVPLSQSSIISDWGPSPSSLQRDSTVIYSPAQTMSSTGALVGSNISIPNYQSGKFTGGSTSNLPVMPSFLATAIPTADNWSTYIVQDPNN
jgi:hypothetical protein